LLEFLRSLACPGVWVERRHRPVIAGNLPTMYLFSFKCGCGLRTIPGIIRILKWLFRLVFLLLLVVGGMAVVGYYYPEKFLCSESGSVTADIIVILGGGSHERPMRAIELYREHAAPRILISGSGDDEINRQILLRAGVPATAIEVEGHSLTTHENAEFSLERLRAEHVRSAILVTSWYHSRRALNTFAHVGPDVQFYSRPSYFAYDRKDWVRLGIYKKIRMEFLKLPGYWIRYGVNPL
jgi:uncharacterized SAM-binding protein YcdF (DUF218 family)